MAASNTWKHPNGGRNKICISSPQIYATDNLVIKSVKSSQFLSPSLLNVGYEQIFGSSTRNAIFGDVSSTFSRLTPRDYPKKIRIVLTFEVRLPAANLKMPYSIVDILGVLFLFQFFYEVVSTTSWCTMNIWWMDGVVLTSFFSFLLLRHWHIHCPKKCMNH